MKLIARKKSKSPAEQAFGYVRLALKGLIAQRVARSAYKGYKWTKRAPWIIGGGALVAFLVRKKQQSAATPSDAGFTPPSPGAPTPSAQPSETVTPSTPTTPTPTGSPTAVSPAPTAAEGAEKDGEPAGDGAPAATPTSPSETAPSETQAAPPEASEPEADPTETGSAPQPKADEDAETKA